ncbi:MAG: hypothetical protein EOO59_17840 [Hymenobacter sp.]|nr:MAG: hypothetical protein EOO59_17840 [Hymenobacter sp.]
MLLLVVSAAVLGGWRYRRLAPPLRYLAWLAWFELPLEVLGIGLALYQQNNLFIMPLYTVGELVLLALAYGAAVRSAGLHRVLPWLVGAFIGYTIFDCLLAPDLTWFKPGQQVLQSLLVLGMVVLYFRQLLHDARVVRLGREPMFWVSGGLALYFLGYLQLALFSNYMLRHYSLQFNKNVWTVHTVLSLILHSSYCVALALRPPPAAPAAPPVRASSQRAAS